MADVKSNVYFKRGTQANLKSATAVDGCFYLTTDTHRLYVGQGSDIVPVNEGVITVAEIKDLPGSGIPGQFYYVSGSNILCVYNGTEWVQINPDSYIKDGEFEAAVSGSTATITQTLDQEGKANDDITSDFKVSVADLKIEKGTAANEIKLTGDRNSLSVADGTDNSATVTLGSSLFGDEDGYDESVKFVGKTGLATGTTGKETTDVIRVEGNGDNIEIQLTSHVGLAANDLHKGNTYKHALSFDANGNLGGTLFTNNGDDIAIGTVLPVIKYGDSNSEAKFANGTATLSVYTKSEIDSQFKTKLNSLNAVVYKGAVTELPTTNVSNGDLYLVKANDKIIVDGVKAKIGDLVIAGKGPGSAEDANGYLTTIEWTLVPSGNEVDTNYNLDAEDGKLILSNDQNSDTKEITLADDDKWISFTGVNDVLTVSHIGPDEASAGDVDAEDSGITEELLQGSSKEFNVVESVQADDKGHVTGVTTKKVSVLDTVVTKVEEDFTVAKATVEGGSGATVSHATTVINGSSDTVDSVATSFSVESTSLNIDIDDKTDKITMNLVWGTF